MMTMTNPTDQQQQAMRQHLARLEIETATDVGEDVFKGAMERMTKAGGFDKIEGHCLMGRGDTDRDINRVIGKENASALIGAACRDVMINASSNGDKVAQRQYDELRAKEREAHARMKGRIR
jgi:hypothetical protein